jgi:aromatic ring-opening dioxygenase LigB subunit
MLSSILMLPHGAEIVPGSHDPYNDAFAPPHTALERAAQQTAADKPDLFILVTPHGYTLPDDYVVYLHSRYQGLLYRLGESNIFGAIQTQAIWPADAGAAERLLAKMRAVGVPTQGLIQGGADYPLTLAWAESVPMHYLMRTVAAKTVIVSLPRQRLQGLMEMQQDLAALGAILLDLAAAHPGPVCVVISADLAHTHNAQGPYGYHPAAARFDAVVQEWVTTSTRDRLEALLALQPDAKACGMAGMCVAQTMIDQTQMPGQLLAYAVPTYFGMAAARWG